MFTGIVQLMGRMAEVAVTDFGARLIINPSDGLDGIADGESICVNGVCLTYAPTAADPSGALSFDVVHETLDKTNLGQLKQGDAVNLERSLTPTTPLGGHFVQGHVDGVGTITSVDQDESDRRMTMSADSSLMQYIVPKGSITCNGVSLTVASVDAQRNTFTVALIPTTLKLTTLDRVEVGDTVNLETDVIAKTVVHWLRHYASQEKNGETLTLEALQRAGFISD